MASACLSSSKASAPARAQTYIERHIARRDAARTFLAGRGMMPQRQQAEHSSSLPAWRVPGWTSLFDDAELIDLARRYGWEGGLG